MVDAIVSLVIERLGDYLIQEVVSLREVKDEVEWLQNKLEWSQCFLHDADEKQEGDERIRKWISDIRDVSYFIEDIVEKSILKIDVPNKAGFRAFFNKYMMCICNKVVEVNLLRNMGNDIKLVKNQLTKIQENQVLFGIKSLSSNAGEGSRLRELRRESPYGDDEHVVGFENDIESLVSELLKGDPHRCVVSIFGMGGLGKTTLARKLFNSHRVRDRFSCYAWVCVSKDYNTRDLLQRIVKFFEPCTTNDEFKKLERMTEEDLESHLRKYLEGRRYMVVVDDVWEKEAWESLRRAFPDSGNGSRVIITTRSEVVAHCSDDRTFAYKLPFLNEEESWELFCKKAFPNVDVGEIESQYPPSLVELARDMVRRCRGLPLAIVVLGGLLSNKHHDEWHHVRDHIWRYVRDGSIHVKLILSLSFSALRPQLKLCFLYVGMFPEDYKIQTDKLLRLWIAEGFIPMDGERVLEEVALEYLNELLDRNLMQVARRDWRRISECSVHDLLRDLAIERAKELKFLHVFDKMIQYSTPSPHASTYRRLAFQLGFKRFVSSDSLYPSLRTLLVFNQEKELVKVDYFKFMHTKFRLLRVLDLNGTRRRSLSLPDSIKNLIHLRYLGLRGTNIAELPPSIGQLRALQTIDVDNVLSLPREIGDLKQLRHLTGPSLLWPFRVDNLTSLQTLKTVHVFDGMEFNLTNLINLRELHIAWEDKGSSPDSIGKLTCLQKLFLEVDFFDLESLSNNQNLFQLKLYGGMVSLPARLHEFLPNVRYLCLHGVKMKEDPLPKLEKLPNLTILDIYYYKGEAMSCSPGGFPQLQVLLLYECELKELRVDGAMPALIGFRVQSDANIKISERLRSIPVPQNWNFREISESFDHRSDTWPY